MADPLTKERIQKELEQMPGWSHEEDKLKKDFKFTNFREAVAFMMRLSFEAEEQVHHPELYNVYNSVSIALSTHDAGGKVTEKDIKLAKTIETLYNNKGT